MTNAVTNAVTNLVRPSLPCEHGSPEGSNGIGASAHGRELSLRARMVRRVTMWRSVDETYAANTVNPEPTRPRNKRDRSMGAASTRDLHRQGFSVVLRDHSSGQELCVSGAI